MITGKAKSSARWFEEHKDCGIEERPVEGLPKGTGMKNFVCPIHKRGLLTTRSPGCKPLPGNIFGGLVAGQEDVVD